jgi:hypothetical protein
MLKRLPIAVGVALALVLSEMCCLGLTLSELRQMPGLTPETLAHLFANFDYEYHAEIQEADAFLTAKRGDCDDFAVLAAEILAERGYTPRLITVRMPGETHVVCYIPERGAYLDYNSRRLENPLVACENRMSVIAASVSRSFERDWQAVYEFTYDRSRQYKRLVNRIQRNPNVAAQARQEPVDNRQHPAGGKTAEK